MILQIIILSLAVLLAILYFAHVLAPTKVENFTKGQVCFGQKCFSVELAKTDAQRGRGLMFRKELNKDAGMLFIFNKEGIFPFWMKNTLISLDIIWINAENKVVYIKEGAQPCRTLICQSLLPSVYAKYVLEINAGLVNECKIKIGDSADFEIPD